MMDSTVAEEYLRLRRDISALKQALQAKEEALSAATYRIAVLEKHRKLVRLELERVGIVAGENW